MSSQPPRSIPGQPPRLEVPADVPVEYVNLAVIVHSASEFVLDFARMLPGAPAPRLTTRLLMSPLAAKLFHRALTENLARYETAFGPISVPGEPSLADGLFHHPGGDPPPGE